MTKKLAFSYQMPNPYQIIRTKLVPLKTRNTLYHTEDY